MKHFRFPLTFAFAAQSLDRQTPILPPEILYKKVLAALKETCSKSAKKQDIPGPYWTQFPFISIHFNYIIPMPCVVPTSFRHRVIVPTGLPHLPRRASRPFSHSKKSKWSDFSPRFFTSAGRHFWCAGPPAAILAALSMAHWNRGKCPRKGWCAALLYLGQDKLPRFCRHLGKGFQNGFWRSMDFQCRKLVKDHSIDQNFGISTTVFYTPNLFSAFQPGQEDY